VYPGHRSGRGLAVVAGYRRELVKLNGQLSRRSALPADARRLLLEVCGTPNRLALSDRSKKDILVDGIGFECMSSTEDQ
jgi:hypothetical protein